MAKHTQKPKQKHVPLRTCIACRETRPKRDLVRIVLTSEGAIVVDETGKQNGRGAYLCQRRSCWQKALKRGSLNRALRTQLSSEDRAVLEAYAESMPESSAEAEV